MESPYDKYRVIQIDITTAPNLIRLLLQDCREMWEILPDLIAIASRVYGNTPPITDAREILNRISERHKEG